METEWGLLCFQRVAKNGKKRSAAKKEVWERPAGPPTVALPDNPSPPPAPGPLMPGTPRLSLTDAELEQFLVFWATFDPRRLYDTEGRLLPADQLDDFTATALTGIRVFEEFDFEDGQRTLVGNTKEFKWEQRVKALELLMRLRGLDGKRSSEKKDRLDEVLAAFKAGPAKNGSSGTTQ